MGLKTMITEAQHIECDASSVPIQSRTPAQIVDAGVKAAVSSEDCVAFIVYASNTFSILKSIFKMFLQQFLSRQRK